MLQQTPRHARAQLFECFGSADHNGDDVFAVLPLPPKSRKPFAQPHPPRPPRPHPESGPQAVAARLNSALATQVRFSVLLWHMLDLWQPCTHMCRVQLFTALCSSGSS